MPPGMQIRNTFLNSRPVRSPSMERVYVERKVRSSPGSRQASLPPGTATISEVEPAFVVSTPTGSGSGTPPQHLPHGSLHELATNQLSKSYLSEQLAKHAHTMPEPCGAAPACGAINDSRRPSNSLSLSSSSGDPYRRMAPTAYEESLATSGEIERQGDELLPSRGSALHEWGACKPCAFFIKEQCTNGKDCQFCHLCEPGEKKRRKKERLSIRRDMREKIRQLPRHGRSDGRCW